MTRAQHLREFLSAIRVAKTSRRVECNHRFTAGFIRRAKHHLEEYTRLKLKKK